MLYARQGYEQVLQLARQLGYRWGEGVTQYELADVLRGQGDYPQALLREIGEPLREAYAVADLSRLYSYLGAYAQARALLEQAQVLTKGSKSPDAHLDRLLASAVLHHQTGEFAAALRYASHCQQVAKASGSRRFAGVAAVYQGYALEGLGEWANAAESYTYALQLFEQLDIVSAAAEAQAGLARVALAQGDQALAQCQVSALLPILAAHPQVEVDEPFLIYLTCYRVLAANADPRALTMLQQGYVLLQHYANQITDEMLRSSFLQQVAVHQALQESYAHALASV